MAYFCPDRARVVYSYVAEYPDELSLQIGDVVNVVETSLEDVGWWKGELGGKVGVFPDNFVELLPPPEVRAAFSRRSVCTVTLTRGIQKVRRPTQLTTR